MERCGSSKRQEESGSHHRITPNPQDTTKPSTKKKQEQHANSDTTHTQLEERIYARALPEVPKEWAMAQKEVIETMKKQWADSTKRSRNRLYNELLDRNIVAPEIPLQTTAAIMIQQKEVKIQTKLTYAKNLQTVLRSMGEETNVMGHYIAGLRKMGAEKPDSQAPPISKQEILAINCPPEVKVALCLAWKTGSRIDEIAQIIKESIVASSPTEVIVNFSDRTKTSHDKPFLPENLCVVSGDLTSYLHENLPAALENWPSHATMLRHLPSPYTGHSIKHGATVVLMEAAANGLVRPDLVSLVLKHRATRAFTPTTVRYAGNRLDLVARAPRTQDATAFL